MTWETTILPTTVGIFAAKGLQGAAKVLDNIDRQARFNRAIVDLHRTSVSDDMRDEAFDIEMEAALESLGIDADLEAEAALARFSAGCAN